MGQGSDRGRQHGGKGREKSTVGETRESGKREKKEKQISSQSRVTVIP